MNQEVSACERWCGVIQCSPLDHGSSGTSFPFTAVHGNCISTSCCVGSQRGLRMLGWAKRTPALLRKFLLGRRQEPK